jgi:hypothetical protein
MAAPVGLARAPSSEAAVLPAVACAAAGFGEGGITSPGSPPLGRSSFEQAGATITIDRAGGGTLSWTSTSPVAAVLVRGGGSTQPWPVGRAVEGEGITGPSIAGVAGPIDDVTFCFPAEPTAPAPETQPLSLSIEAQGSFTRAPAAVWVRGTVTVHNPNPTASSMAGLEVQPSTKGTCSVVSPLQVPSGDTAIAFTCDIDIPDAARQGTVAVTARSGSAPTPAATTVRWLESTG